MKKAAEPLTTTFENVVENVKKAVKIEVKQDDNEKAE